MSRAFFEGVTHRTDSGRPAETVVTHTIEEMIEEAAKRHARQLAEVVRMGGCMVCSDDAVAIQYPPDWETQLVHSLRHPELRIDGVHRAIEVRTRLRPLCAAHIKVGWESA